ncbi:uncharacterized protein K452DRAFT_269877 [Aplosporella prunicola CBS 121167]|uniref:Uncharacterized protein n=1 Tax=Aplosporella prunicola CBS 121167 TaxID=1176127 RepID=A0A6A6BDQ4_9PEZI|nr:uncharacterized protein K452DRAFT_269877 [Aplosporella prunicola CBS 121167]KAF2142310.1 hypothetical protein K452DRAFT_269877 [Aplosporella prunicola CBS 121167]
MPSVSNPSTPLVAQERSTSPVKRQDEVLVRRESEPVREASLGRWTASRWVVLVFDILLSILPLLFVVLAIIACTLDQKRTSSFGSKVQKALLVSPTIFPIVFAALMGKFFRTYGLYRAERGVLLGTLEQLIGCQSLFAAIERQVSLQRLDLLGFVVIILWCLSPIGGQSALRLLSTTTHMTNYNTTLKYLPIEASKFSWMGSGTGSSFELTPFNALFTSSILTTKASRPSEDLGMDIWGNVKIPSYTLLDSSDTDSKLWRSVNHSSPITYSSLLGVPVAGLPEKGKYNFTTLSHRWTVSCSSGENRLYGKPSITGFKANFTLASLAALGDKGVKGSELSINNCSISAQEYETIIDCQGKTCRADSMRLVEVDRCYRDYYFTPFLGNTLLDISKAFTRDQSDWVSGSSIFEQWLVDPNTNFEWQGPQGQKITYVNLTEVPRDVLSQRLEVAINTFWQSTYGVQYVMGDLDRDLGFYDNASTGGTTGDSQWLVFNTTSALVTLEDGQKYVCHWTWVVLLIAVSFVLVIAASISLYLKAIILAPDILGYASSLARDNPYIAAMDGGSHLDGLERTHLLRNVKVMIADVHTEADVGHIAFTAQENEPQRLRKSRQYD